VIFVDFTPSRFYKKKKIVWFIGSGDPEIREKIRRNDGDQKQ
jgi:hypothetical protein